MTIVDIAKLADCAVSTVSRALNNHPDVSEETKARIRKIVEENHFIPNTNAKHLKQQVTNNIVVLVKGNSNLFFASIIERIQSNIGRAGYGVMLHYISEDANEVQVAEQLCKESKPRGVIFLGGNIETFQKGFNKSFVPSVLTSTSAKTLHFHNLSSVSVDDVKGAALAIDYLIAQGHRKIGVVGGSPSLSLTTELRLVGCKNSFAAHGVAFCEKRYRPCLYTLGAGYRATVKLLADNPDITAIFAFSDLIAFGAVRAIMERGLRVPADISVVGFDGLELSNYFQPRLTTCKQPAHLLADNSVRLLLEAIEQDAPPRHLLLDVSLARGESVREIPPAQAE